MLAEGNSIRSVERVTGVHRDTIMRLGLKVGTRCAQILDEEMKNIPCKNIQVDEIWGFVGKKKKNASHVDKRKGLGDVWTWVAIDAETKLVPSFRIGTRSQDDACAFMRDLRSRINDGAQISSDGLKAYKKAVSKSFGKSVDYGQIVKKYVASHTTKRYSPPAVVGVWKKQVLGSPKKEKISTSYIERQNLTVRMHCRRLTRLTNAFSKKLENFKAAVALHFAYYNFVKSHKSVHCTPAMAAGIADNFWSVEELVEMSA